MTHITAFAPAAVPAKPPRPARLPGLSIILPCLDEADNVAGAIRAASAAAAGNADDYEIIVVDDGSSDGTGDIAAAFARRDRHVRLVVHPANRGYGDALRSGVDAARQPWILLTDADLQFDLDEVRDFVPFTDAADLVIGWRILRRDPWHRRVNAAAWNWLVRRVFHLPVRDVDCAFKLCRRELLQQLELSTHGAMISTELLVRSLAAGAQLCEVGVHHRPRIAGEPTGAAPRVVLRALRELAALRRQLAHRDVTPQAAA